MKSLIRWAVHHAPGMNTLMLAVLVVGGVSMSWLRREVFPEFELEIVYVTVPYPGASPDEIEEGICQKMEEGGPLDRGDQEADLGRAGGAAGPWFWNSKRTCRTCRRSSTRSRRRLTGSRASRIWRKIPTCSRSRCVRPAIRVGVVFVGPGRRFGGLGVAIAGGDGVGPRRDSAIVFGLTGGCRRRSQLSDRHRDSRSDAAQIRAFTQGRGADGSSSERRAARRQDDHRFTAGVDAGARDKRLVGDEIKNIPIVTQANGVVLSLGELGEVRDEFADTTSISRINGKPGLPISVNRTSTEDVISIVDDVLTYAETAELPPGVRVGDLARSFGRRSRTDRVADAQRDARLGAGVLGAGGVPGNPSGFLGGDGHSDFGVGGVRRGCT